MNSAPPLAAHALAYARAGRPGLPLRPCGKQPLSRHGVKDATTDADVIRSWWQRWPEANIGLAIPPGFVVVDVDAQDALDRLRADALPLPATAQATTGRRQHFWYATPGVVCRNRVGLLPGIDLRAPGGYVVAPPSVHPGGMLYRWVIEPSASTIAECPEWLLQRVAEPSQSRARSPEEWSRRIAGPVPKGRRNQTLAQVAGLLFRRLPARVAAEFALCWAQVKLSPPLPPGEVQRTIESIAGREVRRRRSNP